ncbi:methionine--tRNA ligase [candidate division KSB3 bacterium]|uniref:Methionine--tRNA ligase n=1 Tax=candidate division KSB3 bacterium TaxID=2044937 RepID=A0A9D5Q6Q7_9BACT|nr:methionine--tRNA ligase [candidate division KSB3 bacterium]MBD3326114.1 methionine--tRNA ligase [candidate division KSB3 bacterium]
MAHKILVTSALPYANGPLHVGHIAGAYLPADIYVRYQRLRKQDIVYVCATDEHGVPITLTAEKEGISPQEVVDRYHGLIKESFERFGMSFDHFSATHRQVHHETSQEFFLKLYEKGYIDKQEIQQMFCPTCDRFLPDRYIEGTCPVCQAEGARGDQCEKCGRWLSPEELIAPKCKICGSAPQMKASTHWFLRLDKFQDRLAAWIDSKPHWKDNVKRFCQEWFKAGLKPRAITRDIDWGIPVPLPEAEGKVLYVWFDAPIGYVSATKEWAHTIGQPDKWKEYWQNPDCSLVHFIGKDNIVFHAMVWPAQLMGQETYVLPTDIPANEFLNLENEKISTSRNFAVWLHEALDTFPADYLRYYLTAIAPERADSNFVWDEFQNRVNGELADIFGNLVNRSLTFVKRFSKGKIPPLNTLQEDDQGIFDAIHATKAAMTDALEHYQFKRAQTEWMNLARLGNQYFQKRAPWELQKSDPDACSTVLHVCTLLVKNLAVLGAPFVPFTAQTTWEILGLEGSVHDQNWDDIGHFTLTPGDPIAKKWGILVGKVQDKAIRAQKEKLGVVLDAARDVQAQPQQPEYPPIKPQITIDEFARIDLRAGKILAAEKVKKSKKLIKMRIDIGSEERTILAGIAQQYEPEQLVGKTVIVVVNLQPAKLMGQESQGMVLAGVYGDDLSVTAFDQSVVPPGAQVR